MDKRGFSLVELICVIAILCILGGIAIPFLEGLKQSMELRKSISRMVTELYRARNTAIKENTYIVFNYDSEGFTLFRDNGSGGGERGDWIQQSGEKTLCSFVLPNSVKIAVDESTFTGSRTRFSGTVGISGGAVVLVSETGTKTRVIINSVSRIRVEKYTSHS